MFFDIHAHVYRKPVPFVVQFCSPDELLHVYDKYNIEKGCLLPIVSSEIYLPQANEDILEIAVAHPDRFIPFCNVDPRCLTNTCTAPLDTVLQYYKDKGCKGVGEIMPNMDSEDPRVLNLLACAEKVGLPVTWDGSDRTYGDFGLCDQRGLPSFERILQWFPNLTVFAHGPIFWREMINLDSMAQRKPVFDKKGEYIFGNQPLHGPLIRDGVVQKLFRAYPNLLGELSEAATIFPLDEDYGAEFLTEFQDRLFFGSDICTKECTMDMATILLKWRAEKRITEEVFYKVAKGNAEKFFA